jgi:hypothetical protein
MSETLTQFIESLGDTARKLPSELNRIPMERMLFDFIVEQGFQPGTGPRDDIEAGPLRNVSGGLVNDIRTSILKERNGFQIDLNLEPSLPYAAIHELGGSFTVPVTEDMRDFFFAKYYQTDEEKWLWMATTRKRQFQIDIEARPYLEPNIERTADEVSKRSERILIDMLLS